MAISYPVDLVATKGKWATIEVATGKITKRNHDWPTSDGMAIPGDTGEFVLLLQSSSPIPKSDERIYTLDVTETVDIPGNTLKTTYVVKDRPVNEVIVAAENIEVEVAFSQKNAQGVEAASPLRLEREAIETRLMLGAILAYVLKAQNMPPKVRDMSDEYIAKATRLFKNRDRLNEVKAQFKIGQKADLDAGWELPE